MAYDILISTYDYLVYFPMYLQRGRRGTVLKAPQELALKTVLVVNHLRTKLISL